MNDLITAAQQVLEALRHVVRQAQENLVPTIHYGPVNDVMNRLEAALAQQAEPPVDDPHRDHWVAIAEAAQKIAASTECGPAEAEALCAALDRLTAAALAQQTEPVEPYCYVYEYDGVFGLHREFYPLPYNGMKPSRTVPVYTAPLQRAPLTDEEIDAIGKALLGAGYGGNTDREFARAVERAHGITDHQIADRLARHGIPMPEGDPK